ncbi:MAG: hypothetical protein RDV41_12435 [Planctomycetota bacterium]|nr:hypothetical protein [Planctomycetota bacterium]
MDRREFLKRLGSYGLGVAALPAAVRVFFEYEQAAFAADPSFKSKFSVEAKYYEKLPEKKTQCHLCPLHCKLSTGET